MSSPETGPGRSGVAPMLAVGEILETDASHTRARHDPAYAAGSAFVIDHFCPIGEAGVPITDLGFIRADAVYDVVTVSRGTFFRLGDHQHRFARSCRRVRLNSPFPPAQEAELLHRLVALAGLKDAYVWWCVTRGANPHDQNDRLDAVRFTNRFFAFAIPYMFIKNDRMRAAGLDLHVSNDRIRIPENAVDPRAKNFCSLDLAMALYEAGDRGADWVVLTDAGGALTEAPGSNIFIVKDGVASTPESGCLEGITRQTALELCAELGIETRTRRIPAVELAAADEAFLTSSAGGILPVAAVNGSPLTGDRKPGPVSMAVHDLYWSKRWSGWKGEAVSYDPA